MTNRTRIVMSLLAVPLALPGCERQPASSSTPAEPTEATNPAPEHAAAPSASEGAGRVEVAGMTFPVPEGWSQVPPANTMRLAQLETPGEPEACEVAFSMAGGTVEANVARWAMQMADEAGNPLAVPAIDTREVGGVSVHTVELQGTYLGMRRTAPKPDTMMRAAIIETASGLLFIKMVGPTDAMTASADGWDALLAGIQAG